MRLIDKEVKERKLKNLHIKKAKLLERRDMIDKKILEIDNKLIAL